MALVLTDVQKVPVAVVAVDAAGNPGRFDGAPEFAVSDDTLAEIQPTEDPLKVFVVTKGPLGTFQLQVSADADLGEGVKPITGTLDIEVQGSEAVALSVVAGAPESRL